MTGDWRKSSHSNPSGNCVEVATLSAAPGDGLDDLRSRYRGWTFWRGQYTGSYWAMARGASRLLCADTVEELARKLQHHSA